MSAASKHFESWGLAYALIVDNDSLLDVTISVELVFEVDIACSDGETEASQYV